MQTIVCVIYVVVYQAFKNGVLSGTNEIFSIKLAEKLASFDNYIAPLGRALPSRLHMRVGKILQVTNHENASDIYMHDVLVNLDPRREKDTISTLRKYQHPFDLVYKNVIVVLNIRHFTYLDVHVEALLLCATSDSTPNPRRAELIVVPEPMTYGERVFFERHQYGRPDPDILNSSRLLWLKLQRNMRVNDQGVVKWENHDLMTVKGKITTRTIRNGYVRLCNQL